MVEHAGGAGDDGPHDRTDDDAPAADADARRVRPPDPLDRVWRHPSELPAPVPVRPRVALPTFAVPLMSGMFGALIAVGLLGAVGWLDLDDETPTEVAPIGTRSTAADERPFASFAADVTPSLVAVSVATPAGSRRGSGVCIRHGGEVLTSAATIGDATEVTVVASDGSEHSATVRGRDLESGLALLSVDVDLPAARISTEVPAPGDSIYAVGAAAAGAKGPWVSHGVVTTVDAVVARDERAIVGVIETDASATVATAGGALVDASGGVLGILIDPADGHAGALAVPVATAAEIAAQIRAKGTAAHAWLGLGAHDDPGGPIVTKVVDGGPAQAAGVRAGDRVVEVVGREVSTMLEVLEAVRAHAPGDRFPIVLLRDGAMQRLVVVLGSKPTEPAEARDDGASGTGDPPGPTSTTDPTDEDG
jgi:S1-C subfamily serine protease